MRQITLAFVLLLLLPHQSLAYTEIVDFFLDYGVETLMRGGVRKLPEEQEALDFTAPLFLDSKGKYRLDAGYENQRTVRIFNGRWARSHAYAEKLETSVAAPFSLTGKKINGTVAAGYGYRWFDFSAENATEGITLKGDENFEAKKGGVNLSAYDRLRLGVSVIATDYRSGLEVPIEAEIAPCDFLRVGYKRSYIDDAADFNVQLSGKSGLIPVHYGEELNELYIVGDYKEIVYGKYAHELGKTGNLRFEGKVRLPLSLYLVGNYRQRDLNFSQDFSVEGKPGGFMRGDIVFREYRGGIGADPTDKWNVELNYRHRGLDSSGGGVAFSSAVVDFWPSLVVGNYNHTYDAAFSIDQYHAGMVYKGENVTLGLGVQYIYLKTAAQLDYWRSVLFGIGRAGANTLQLDTDRVKLLFLSLGLGYRWQNVAVNYAFGQFVPLGTHDNKPASATPPTSSGGGGGGTDIFESIADKIDHNPGGNIQRVLLTIAF
jgi:hypothetical protein